MENVGFAFERELGHGPRGLPHVLYRITRDAYRASDNREEPGAQSRNRETPHGL